MLLFKNLENELDENLEKIYENVPEIYKNNLKMIIKDEDEVIGSCFYEIEGQFCKLNYVHMMTDEELIKDGLIRTLINAMDLLDVTKIIVKIARDESFYAKIGFNPLFFSDFMIDLKGEESNYLILDTKDFFATTCCSSK